MQSLQTLQCCELREQHRDSDFYPKSTHLWLNPISYTLSCCAIQNPLLLLTGPSGVTTCWSERSPLCSVPSLPAPRASPAMVHLRWHRAHTYSEGKAGNFSDITVHWAICHDIRRCLPLVCNAQAVRLTHLCSSKVSKSNGNAWW